MDELAISLNKLVEQLKQRFKNYISSHVISLKDLVDLYNAVIEQNESKIDKLQYAIPNLSINPSDLIKQDEKAKLVKQEIEKALLEVHHKISTNKIMSPVLTIPLYDYQWSSDKKHENIIISNKTAETNNFTEGWERILLEPSLSMIEITRIRLKISQTFKSKQGKTMLSLCDVSIAQQLRNEWDERFDLGEGTYSHDNDGQIFKHHFHKNQKKGQSLAFKFQDGDILEMEWNGPMRQFTTSNPFTKQKYQIQQITKIYLECYK